MPKNAVLNARDWRRPALIGVGLITALRVVLLGFNRTDLFVDEAQYWLWGQDLAFGYYSKPPLIGWVIRAFTELGSDAQFWIRLPGPLFHGATALILGAIAARLLDARTAILTSLAYVTLPMVALASLLISTDTIMFPFLAGAFLGYLRVAERRETSIALLTGLALGLAFMAKYAAIYYVICAGLGALLVPESRPGWRCAGLILLAFLVTISPNILWNLSNGLTTVQHTLDNADWVRDPGARAALNLSGLAEFLAAQFAVTGPVLFVALFVVAFRAWPQTRLLIAFSLPILAIVCVQALLSYAYANWAAAAYLAGTIAAIRLIRDSRPWLIASFVINGAFCLLFPIASTMPEVLTRDGQPLLNRYIGRTEMTEAILSTADAQGLNRIVATDRDILADLFYTARDRDIGIFALPPEGRAPHHYALRFPFRETDGEILLILRQDEAPLCANALKLLLISPETGAYIRRPLALYRAPAGCVRQ